MEIETLDKQLIYDIHEFSLKKYGGRSGNKIDTDSKIESILSQQYPCFGYDKYETIFEKSAMLSYFFAKDHCFEDGNKRVAMFCLYMFLKINGYQFTLTENEATQFIITIVESKHRGEEIDNYIYGLADFIEENSMII